MYGYVYLTQNMLNGRVYIGQHKAKEFDTKYYGSGKILRQAIEKYGIECFNCELLESCDTKEQLNLAEKNWIIHFKSLGDDVDLYNIADGGEGGDIYHTLSNEDRKKFRAKCKPDKSKRDYVASGKKAWETRKRHGTDKMSDEQRQKLVDSHKGKKRSIESVNKGVRTRKQRGYKHSDVTKRKISEGNKGKKLSDEQRKKLSERNKLRVGELNAFYGKTHSDETKLHIGEKSKEWYSKNKVIWINDGKTNTRIPEEQFLEYQNKGYKKGRIKWANH